MNYEDLAGTPMFLLAAAQGDLAAVVRESGITKEELAARAGISAQTVSSILNGTCDLRMSTVCKVLSVVNRSKMLRIK